MKEIPFIKMHGLGNSYIYIDTHKCPLPENQLSRLAIEISKSSTGIGSDGLILIQPSNVANLKMRIFNKDGSEGKNCGNGLRCVAKYAYEKGLVSSETMKIETLSGIVQADIIQYQGIKAMVSVNMGKPQLNRYAIPMNGVSAEKIVSESFQINGHKLEVTAISMGNPHAVFFVPNHSHSQHAALGPLIEKDVRFPEGVNVEFVYVESETSLHCRVWERGSGITQSCGTGACAVAVASILNGFSKMDDLISVHLEGGTLLIKWQKNGEIMMTGPAVTVASGHFCIN